MRPPVHENLTVAVNVPFEEDEDVAWSDADPIVDEAICFRISACFLCSSCCLLDEESMFVGRKQNKAETRRLWYTAHCKRVICNNLELDRIWCLLPTMISISIFEHGGTPWPLSATAKEKYIK